MMTSQASKRRLIRVRENWYRDVWLLIITIIVVIALHEQSVTSDRIQEGRRTASAINCAILGSVATAGKQVIEGQATGAATQETRFVRFLEKHGYPPPKIRMTQAAAAGNAYVRLISQRIQDEIGGKGAKLIRADGTINCAQLARLSHVPLPK